MVFKFSKVAANNATADPTINYAEGQAPSSLNDSARAAMARGAQYRDDISGMLTTSGTSTAYTVSSNQGFDTLANTNGMMIAFTPHTGNGATVTLNVDGLGAKPLRLSPNVELQTGLLITGTPYTAIYNNTDGVWYLRGFGSDPYGVPLGAGLDYWLPTSPNSAFAFPSGQAISRTMYSSLFSLMGTTFGSGDGSTTFNLPDKRGRASFAADNLGSGPAGRITAAFFGNPVLGAGGGSQAGFLTSLSMLPPYTPSGGIVINGGTNQVVDYAYAYNNGVSPGNSGGAVSAIAPGATLTAIGTNTYQFNGGAVGSSAPFSIMPPTIICRYIMRII